MCPVVSDGLAIGWEKKSCLLCVEVDVAGVTGELSMLLVCEDVAGVERKDRLTCEKPESGAERSPLLLLLEILLPELEGVRDLISGALSACMLVVEMSSVGNEIWALLIVPVAKRYSCAEASAVGVRFARLVKALASDMVGPQSLIELSKPGLKA